MTLSQAISARIGKLLKEKTITQYKLAYLSGVPLATVADIIKMRNKGTNINNIHAIAEGFGMDLTEFFNSPLFKYENITD